MDKKHVLSYHKGHPDPQKYRENYELLDGEWKFVFDEENVGLRDHYEKEFPGDCLSIAVPYPYQSPMSGINLPDKQCDVIWYEREFDIADTECDHIVVFGAVDYKATVFVNGINAYFNEGGYNSFQVNVTPYVKIGKNKITLRIEDEMSVDQIRGKQRWLDHSYTCFYTETSGIVRDVYIEHLNRKHIDSFRFKADYGKKLLKVSASAEKAAGCELRVTVSDIDRNIIKTGKVAFSQKDVDLNITFDEVKPWSSDDPYLYNVLLELICNGETVDSVQSYCGFVSYETKDGRFYVNGKDTYLKFVLNQGYFEDTITTPTEEEIVKDAELMLACGFNGARMHQHTPSALNFYYLDLLGIYAWQECPSAHAYSNKAKKQYFRQYPALFADHFSHPCIMAYVIFNESWGVWEIKNDTEMQDVATRMYEKVKEMAEDRFVISNDGWEHTISDVITFHNYSETYEELSYIFNDCIEEICSGNNADCIKDYRKFFAGDYRYGNQPLMLSEFAGIAFDKDCKDSGWGYGKAVREEKDFLSKYGAMLDAVYDCAKIRGFCITQLTDVYQEKNGLVTLGREEKISPAALKALHEKFI